MDSNATNQDKGNYPSKRAPVIKRGLIKRWRTFLRDRKTKRSVPVQADLSLTLVHGTGPLLLDAEIAVVVAVRGERKYLPSFLKHYRQLGVKRFIFVDDKSSDKTAEYLKMQGDVDLWESVLRYNDAGRGRLWRAALMGMYGLNRWYLNIDIDEYLSFDAAPTKNLNDLTRYLQFHGYQRMPAPMIDFYPISTTDCVLTDDVMPWDLATQFDGSGYHALLRSKCWSVKGGPRARKLGLSNELIKYPLIFWDEKCALGKSIHSPEPSYRNFAPILGVLLHFKFFSDIDDKVTAAIADNQYYNDSFEYRAIKKALSSDPSLTFYDSSVSVTYTGPGQLIELGFMPELWN